jgi:hypothetical protein
MIERARRKEVRWCEFGAEVGRGRVVQQNWDWFDIVVEVSPLLKLAALLQWQFWTDH